MNSKTSSLKKPMPQSNADFERRISISLTVARYLRAAERFEAVSHEFTEACDAVRAQLSEPRRFVTEVNYRHYFVTSDRDGNFEVEEVESI